MPGRPRIYWDANIFLAAIGKEEPWLNNISALLEAANRRNEVEIITSVLTITEVVFGLLEREQGRLRKEAEEEINRFWTESRGIKVVEFDDYIGRATRSLRRQDWERGWKAHFPDLIHLATAQHQKVNEVHTLDQTLHRYREVIDIPVGYPIPPQATLPGI